MKKAKFKQLLGDYFNGDNPQIKELLDQWYDSFPEKSAHEVFQNEQGEKRIQKEIRSRLNQHWKAEPQRKRFFTYLPYAAVFLLLLLASYLYQTGTQKQDFGKELRAKVYSTESRQIKKITLSDSSIVWLNANSRIRIPEDFSKAKQRNLYLEEGEVFFDIAKQAKRPFLVHTDTLAIQVLGTSFNIRNYHALARVFIGVSTGKVSVSTPSTHAEILQAKEQLIYDRHTHQFTKDEAIQGGWRTGKIILKEARFEELALALYHIYGIHIKQGDEQLSQYTFDLTLQTSRSLDETMQLICSIHNNKYRRTKNEIIIY